MDFVGFIELVDENSCSHNGKYGKWFPPASETPIPINRYRPNLGFNPDP